MKTQLGGAALAALLTLATPASGQDATTGTPAPSVQIAQATPAPAPSQLPPAADAPAKAGAPTAAPKAQLYGLVNLQYARTDAPSPAEDSSTFEARRVRIGARGDVTPQLGYTVQLEALDASLKDAYLALKRLPVPGLEVRAGQWKTPFGVEQPQSDTLSLWVNSSYVVQALARSTSTASLSAAGDARDLGVGVVGKWALGGGAGAELAASVVNGSGPSRRDDLEEKNFWGRAGVSLEAGPARVKAGTSYGYGHQVAGLGANTKFDGVGTPVDDTYFYFSTYGADVSVDTPWVYAVAEVIQSERDVWNHATGARPNVNARGWYAGAYGKTPWNVGPIFRAEKYDRDREAGNDVNERYTVGAYLDVLPVNARFILNWELDRSQQPVRTGDRAIAFAQVVF
jgi:phosphate-selective porin O/P